MANGKNPAVAEVAEGIGVDPDATPEEAALEEAAQAGAAAQAQAVDATTPPIDPETQAPTVTEVGGTGEPPMAGDTPDQPVGGRQRLPQQPSTVEQNLRNIPSTPTRRQTKKEAKEARATARDAKKTDSPGLKSLGGLGKKLPGAEHVKIYKRDDKGKLFMIDVYDANDLSQSQDVEDFVTAWLKPKFGPGEYPIVGVNARGEEFDAGSVRVMAPQQKPTPKPGITAMDVLNDWLMKDAERRERELAELRVTLAAKPQEKDPFETLGKALDLQKRVSGEASRENEGTMAALIASMSEQNQVMIRMMMEQQNKSSEQLLTILTALQGSKGPDPIMATLVAGLLEDRKKGGGDPLPPMPQPKDPAEELKTLAEVMVLLRPPEKEGDNEMLKYLLAKAEKESISPKEMIELVRGERGTDDFKRSFDNLGLMLTAMRTLKEHTGEAGAGASGFWDALAQLASNRDFAGSIASAIRAKSNAQLPGRHPVQALPGRQHPALTAGVQDQQAIQQMEERLRAIRAKRVAIAQELAAEEAALDQEIAQIPEPHQPRVRPDSRYTPHQPPVVTSPSGQVSPAVPGAPTAVQVPPLAQVQPGAPVATPEQEAAVARAVQRTGRYPQLPPEIANHVNALLEAADEAECVERVVRMLFYLAELEDWADFANTVMVLIREGDKENVFAFLSEFFNGLRDLGFMDQVLMDNVLKAFNNHFEMVVNMSREAAEVEEEPEGEEGDEGGEGEDLEPEEPLAQEQ